MFLWKARQILFRLEFWSLSFFPIGAAWTLYQIIAETKYEAFVEPYVDLILILLPVSLVFSARSYWPKSSASVEIPNSGTIIEVCVGDIFKSNNPIVVTIPTTLETDFHDHSIDPLSIQGQFTKKYAKDPANLEKALKKSAAKSTPVRSISNYYSNGKSVPEYKSGELFVLRDFSRVGYLVSFASFNEHGNVSMEPEQFFEFLPRLWLNIGNRGVVGEVDVPLLGAKFPRNMLTNRLEILREILNSFSAACAEAKICDHVTIYIRPKDFHRWNFTMDHIERLLKNIHDDHIRGSASRADPGRGIE